MSDDDVIFVFDLISLSFTTILICSLDTAIFITNYAVKNC